MFRLGMYEAPHEDRGDRIGWASAAAILFAVIALVSLAIDLTVPLSLAPSQSVHAIVPARR